MYAPLKTDSNAKILSSKEVSQEYQTQPKARSWTRCRVVYVRTLRLSKHNESYAIKCKNAINMYQCDLEFELIQSKDFGKFYRYVNKKLSSHVMSSHKSCPVKDMHGNLVSNPTDQSDLFNQYFASVFTVDDSKYPKNVRLNRTARMWKRWAVSL